MAEVTRRRVGELQRAAFQVLLDAPAGLQASEVITRAEEICPATTFEDQDYPNSPGTRRYPKMLRFATIGPVKAGWLVKEKGIWRLTDAGRAAYEKYTDPVEFRKAASAGYYAWVAANKPPVTYDADEAAEDAAAAALELGTTRPRKAWRVRGANVLGVNVLPQWFADGFCSITSLIPDLPPGTPKIEIAKHVREAYPDMHLIAQGQDVGLFHRFVNEMAIDDLVVTVDGGNVYVGTITGEPEYVEAQYTDRRRSVEWANADSPFKRSELSANAADGLRGQHTVTELTPFLREFARLSGIELDVAEEPVSAGEIEVSIAHPSPALAEELLLPVEWLRETIELLNDKRQIVLYGPPGTGKTYLAQELSKALVQPAGGEYTIVQFHPSYAYEDFFEGLRPRLTQDGSGGVAFDLVPGPLRRMAAQAAENPSKPYVLIIDEINRANLAKVFGELYFLLEYRGQAVALQYSEEEFRLPRNVFIIGTMNTADRSIALVDAAMRRRFYFQGLFPGAEPIKDVLRLWLAQEKLPGEAADLLAALNETINDEDFAIGPSYLMTKRVAQPGGLERIWKTAILPLLAEHHFGEGRDIEAQFGLKGLRKRLEKPASAIVAAAVTVPAEEPTPS